MKKNLRNNTGYMNYCNSPAVLPGADTDF